MLDSGAAGGGVFFISWRATRNAGWGAISLLNLSSPHHDHLARPPRITARVDPPARAAMSPHGAWRESGGIVTLGWHYLVEVIPPADVECERWSLPARDYDVALTLHRAPSPPDAPEAAFTASFRLDALLDHVERDTGCALSVRDALLLLRLGLRGGAPVRDDDGSTWRRAFVDVETGTNPTSNPDSPSGHPRLLVTVRNVTYATSTTLALPPPGAAVRPGDASLAASTTKFARSPRASPRRAAANETPSTRFEPARARSETSFVSPTTPSPGTRTGRETGGVARGAAEKPPGVWRGSALRGARRRRVDGAGARRRFARRRRWRRRWRARMPSRRGARSVRRRTPRRFISWTRRGTRPGRKSKRRTKPTRRRRRRRRRAATRPPSRVANANRAADSCSARRWTKASRERARV